jgi:hypothetical protein
MNEEKHILNNEIVITFQIEGLIYSLVESGT